MIAEHFHHQITEFKAKNIFPIIMEFPIKREKFKDPLTEFIPQVVEIKLEL